MKIKVRYFAYYRERIGSEYEEIEIPEGSTVEDLVSALSRIHPGKFQNNDIFVSIDYRFAGKNDRIPENKIIGIMPHVSGG